MISNISPKVVWPVVVGLVLPSVITNVNLITPDMLNFLGPWKFFVLQTLTSIIGGAVGYAVKDPARAAAAVEAPAAPAVQPAPQDVVANLVAKSSVAAEAAPVVAEPIPAAPVA